MPEKPEVITVSKSLETKILDRTIIDVDVYWDNIIAIPSSDEFIKRIKNQIIKKISTRGKFIVITLDKDTLLVHLRMEGKFFFRDEKSPIVKHEHVVFTFDNGEQMRFHDVRKFGKMYLIPTEEVYKVKPLVELGYEFDDEKLNGEYLYRKLNKKSLPIKTVLLDQSIITGIGNIYDDEILFLSKISPYRKAKDITLGECEEIIKNTNYVLKHAIELGGTTIKSFTSSEGVHGRFQNELAIHGKKNSKCPECGSDILVVKIGGRGTYYCDKCQK